MQLYFALFFALEEGRDLSASSLPLVKPANEYALARPDKLIRFNSSTPPAPVNCSRNLFLIYCLS